MTSEDGAEMEDKQAMEMILKLVDGVDPETGAALPADSVVQKPQVMRALFASVLALKFQAKHRPGRD